MRITTAVLTTLLAATAAGCAKKDANDRPADTLVATTPGTVPAPTPTPAAALAVTDVRLGKAVDANKRVADDTDDFKPGDTIYASVLTSGAASGTVQARWTFEDGQLVDSTSQSISPTGDAATEFHISKAGGLPKGKYKLTVLLNGTEAKTKDFEVE